jgi:hypothetical protein
MEPTTIAVGRAILDLYGPMAIGWIAWLFTMLYLGAERKRYQELVIHMMEILAKRNLAERKTDVESPIPIEVIEALTGKRRIGRTRQRRSVSDSSDNGTDG